MTNEPSEPRESSGLIMLVLATLCLLAIIVIGVVRLIVGSERMDDDTAETSVQREGPPLAPLAARAEANRLHAVSLALESDLRTVRASTDAGVAAPGESFRASRPDARADVALSFPVNVPDVYMPRHFEQIAHRAATECGMEMEVFAIDCTEFPCIAWMEAKNAGVRKFSMSGCAPWEEAFQHGTSVVASVQKTDGTPGPRFLSWMPMPPDPADQMIAIQRAKERTRGMKEALGAR